MKLAWAAIALFCVRFLTAAWFYPQQDADLAWQQKLGASVLATHALPTRLPADTFTAAGAPWVPQEWLFSTLVTLAMQAHRFGWLAIAASLSAALALSLVALRAALARSSHVPIAFTVLCTGVALAESFGVRAQVFAWPIFAALLLVLDLEGNAIFWAIPLTALWANIHASAVLAPVVAAVWTLGTAIEDRGWTPRVERNVVVTAGTCVAILCTPFFVKLPLYAFALATSPLKATIAEWQPAELSYYAFALGLVPLLLCAAWLGVAAPRERWRDGFVVAVLTGMAFVAVRNIGLCAVALAPLVAMRLTAFMPHQRRYNAIFEEVPAQTLLAAGTVIAAIALTLTLVRSPEISGNTLPVRAISAARAAPGGHRLYCEDFAWCSLALATPNVRTFLDGRCDPFPLSVWNAYLAVQRLEPQWQAILNGQRVDEILAAAQHPLAEALALQPQWRVAYEDRRFVLFVRTQTRTAQR